MAKNSDNSLKDAIEKFYIQDNHTFKECLNHFNLTNYTFSKLLQKFNLCKLTTKSFLESVDREDLYNYYIRDDHSFADTIIKFNTTSDILRSAISKLNFDKAGKIYSETQLLRSNAFNKVSKSDLIQYYIVEKHSQDATCNHFNIRNTDLIKLLATYKINKIASKKYPTVLKNDLCNIISKKELFDSYITNNLSVKELSSKYKVCVANINYLLKLYQINKPYDLTVELMRKTKIKNYGTLVNPQNFNNFSKEFQELYYNRDKSLQFLNIKPRYKAKNLAEKFDCPIPTVFYWVNKLNLREYICNEKSHYESDIIDYLRLLIPNIKIKTHVRKYLNNNQEIDIFLPEYNLGIEFNGTYWHSNLVILNKKYHLQKSIDAQNAGIHLVHIYEFEWNDPHKQELIKTLLKLFLHIIPNRIYARNCAVKKISNTVAKPFNNQNHLQGHRNAQITYGLYYNNELVQLMSFSNT